MCANEELANRVTQTVAAVGRPVRVAGIRRSRHPDPNVLHRHRRDGKLNRGAAALAVVDDAVRKGNPRALRRLLDRVFAVPVLDHVLPREGLGPGDPHGVERTRGCQVDNHPLRMKRIVFARVRLRQVGIALPVGVQVAIGESRVADHICAVIVSDAAMRQGISVGMANGLTEGGASGEITFARGIAPSALRIPVPGFHVKLGVLAVADRLPSGGEHLLDRRLDESFVRGAVREPVDAGAQGLRGDDRVGRMARRGIHANRLSAQRRCEQKENCDEPIGKVSERVFACQHLPRKGIFKPACRMRGS